MATKIATTITTTMRNLLRAHVRVCVHHNNNGKHSVLVPFETDRQVKTKRTKPARSEEDTIERAHARGRFSNSRAQQKTHVAVCKKMRGARRKRHDHRTQRRTSSWSRVVSSFSFFHSLSLSLSLFFFARCCSMSLRPSKRARVFNNE